MSVIFTRAQELLASLGLGARFEIDGFGTAYEPLNTERTPPAFA